MQACKLYLSGIEAALWSVTRDEEPERGQPVMFVSRAIGLLLWR